jgi:hypothetical protein
LFTLGFCLALGVFLGLLVTGVQRVVPEIRRQMREAESRARLFLGLNPFSFLQQCWLLRKGKGGSHPFSLSKPLPNQKCQAPKPKKKFT